MTEAEKRAAEIKAQNKAARKAADLNKPRQTPAKTKTPVKTKTPATPKTKKPSLRAKKTPVADSKVYPGTTKKIPDPVKAPMKTDAQNVTAANRAKSLRGAQKRYIGSKGPYTTEASAAIDKQRALSKLAEGQGRQEMPWKPTTKTDIPRGQGRASAPAKNFLTDSELETAKRMDKATGINSRVVARGEKAKQLRDMRKAESAASKAQRGIGGGRAPAATQTEFNLKPKSKLLRTAEKLRSTADKTGASLRKGKDTVSGAMNKGANKVGSAARNVVDKTKRAVTAPGRKLSQMKSDIKQGFTGKSQAELTAEATAKRQAKIRSRYSPKAGEKIAKQTAKRQAGYQKLYSKKAGEKIAKQTAKRQAGYRKLYTPKAGDKVVAARQAGYRKGLTPAAAKAKLGSKGYREYQLSKMSPLRRGINKMPGKVGGILKRVPRSYLTYKAFEGPLMAILNRRSADTSLAAQADKLEGMGMTGTADRYRRGIQGKEAGIASNSGSTSTMGNLADQLGTSMFGTKKTKYGGLGGMAEMAGRGLGSAIQGVEALWSGAIDAAQAGMTGDGSFLNKSDEEWGRMGLGEKIKAGLMRPIDVFRNPEHWQDTETGQVFDRGGWRESDAARQEGAAMQGLEGTQNEMLASGTFEKVRDILTNPENYSPEEVATAERMIGTFDEKKGWIGGQSDAFRRYVESQGGIYDPRSWGAEEGMPPEGMAPDQMGGAPQDEFAQMVDQEGIPQREDIPAGYGPPEANINQMFGLGNEPYRGDPAYGMRGMINLANAMGNIPPAAQAKDPYSPSAAQYMNTPADGRPPTRLESLLMMRGEMGRDTGNIAKAKEIRDRLKSTGGWSDKFEREIKRREDKEQRMRDERIGARDLEANTRRYEAQAGALGRGGQTPDERTLKLIDGQIKALTSKADNSGLSRGEEAQLAKLQGARSKVAMAALPTEVRQMMSTPQGQQQIQQVAAEMGADPNDPGFLNWLTSLFSKGEQQ